MTDVEQKVWPVNEVAVARQQAEHAAAEERRAQRAAKHAAAAAEQAANRERKRLARERHEAGMGKPKVKGPPQVDPNVAAERRRAREAAALDAERMRAERIALRDRNLIAGANGPHLAPLDDGRPRWRCDVCGDPAPVRANVYIVEVEAEAVLATLHQRARGALGEWVEVPWHVVHTACDRDLRDCHAFSVESLSSWRRVAALGARLHNDAWFRYSDWWRLLGAVGVHP